VLPRRWGPRLFAAFLAAVASPAIAHQVLYDEDSFKLIGSFDVGLGGYSAGNVDLGAGNINTNAPLGGPFAPSQRRTDRQWFEGFVKPFLV
jgi:hypothetical protein